MSLFVVDTAGDKDLINQKAKFGRSNGGYLDEKPSASEARPVSWDDDDDAAQQEDADDDGDFFGLPPPSVDLSKIIDSALAQTQTRKSKVEQDLETANDAFHMAVEKVNTHKRTKRGRIVELDHSDFNPQTGKYTADEKLMKTDVDKEMSSTTMGPGFEKLKDLPNLARRNQRKLDRIEREKTKGAGWFNLPATEVTAEVENDLKILQMRSVLDPKHFYKKNDLKVLPKYFQIGTVQHSHLDYYSERDTRKNKKRSLVDELLADAEALKYTKRKYKEVVAIKEKYARRKAMNKMKKLKKNK